MPEKYPVQGRGMESPPQYARVTRLLSDDEIDKERDRAKRYPEARPDAEDWLAALMAEARRRARQ